MRCYARVDLRRLVSNYENVQSALGKDIAILAVVKADAYGHGAVPVSKALYDAGCRHFAVACTAEGVELRQAGLEGEIALLSGFLPGEEGTVRSYQLTPVLHDLALVERWARMARDAARQLRCHVKVDTGMNRLGIPASEWERSAGLLAGSGLIIEGLATHLASAEDFTDPAVCEQLKRFDAAVSIFRRPGVEPRRLHVANSATLAYRSVGATNMARPGLALYGLLTAAVGNAPDPGVTVEPALEWRAKILSVRQIETGDRVGYNGLFQATRPMKLAAVAAGYADGLRRELFETGEVHIEGRPCPFVGRISMDVSMVDVSEIPGPTPGMEAVLIGDAMKATEMARRAGTIAYEVLCAISPRVPRLYVT